MGKSNENDKFSPVYDYLAETRQDFRQKPKQRVFPGFPVAKETPNGEGLETKARSSFLTNDLDWLNDTLHDAHIGVLMAKVSEQRDDAGCRHDRSAPCLKALSTAPLRAMRNRSIPFVIREADFAFRFSSGKAK